MAANISVLLEIFLMVLLCLVELASWYYLSYYRFSIDIGEVPFRKDLNGSFFLCRRIVEYHGSVLCPVIGALSIESGRIMDREEMLEYPLV